MNTFTVEIGRIKSATFQSIGKTKKSVKTFIFIFTFHTSKYNGNKSGTALNDVVTILYIQTKKDPPGKV